MIQIKDVEKHIKKCIRYKKGYNWLGFVESKDLSPEVESLFSVGIGWWDWVNGNSKLKSIVNRIEEEKRNKK